MDRRVLFPASSWSPLKVPVLHLIVPSLLLLQPGGGGANLCLRAFMQNYLRLRSLTRLPIQRAVLEQMSHLVALLAAEHDSIIIQCLLLGESSPLQSDMLLEAPPPSVQMNQSPGIRHHAGSQIRSIML